MRIDLKCPWILSIGILIAASFSYPATSQTVTLQDSTFATGAWSPPVIAAPPSTSAHRNVAQQFVSGAYRTVHQFNRASNNNEGSIVVVHLKAGATHNPAQSSVTSATFSYRLGNLTTQIRGTAGGYSPDPYAQAGVAYGLIVRQNSVNYLYRSDTDVIRKSDVLTSGWKQVVQAPVSAASFVRLGNSGAEKPDFSCSGASLQWGFATLNSTGNLMNNVPEARATLPNPVVWWETSSDLDDWKVELATSPCVTPPPTPPVSFAPCCPPVNKERINQILHYREIAGGVSGTYTLRLDLTSPPGPLFSNQMHAYAAFAYALNSAVTRVEIEWHIRDLGVADPGEVVCDVSRGTAVGSPLDVRWTHNAWPPPSVTNVFSTTAHAMQPNRWYSIVARLALVDTAGRTVQELPADCSLHCFYLNVQILSGRQQPTIIYRDARSIVRPPAKR